MCRISILTHYDVGLITWPALTLPQWNQGGIDGDGGEVIIAEIELMMMVVDVMK